MSSQVNRATPSDHTFPKRIVADENGNETNVLPPNMQPINLDGLVLQRFNEAEQQAVEMALADDELGLREAALLRSPEYDQKVIELMLQEQGGAQAVKDYQKAKEMFAAIDAAHANGRFDADEVAHLRALGDKLGFTNEQITGAIQKLHGSDAALQFTTAKPPNSAYPPGSRIDDLWPSPPMPAPIPLPRQTLDRPGPWGLRPVPLPQQTLPDRTGPDGAQPVPLPKVE